MRFGSSSLVTTWIALVALGACGGDPPAPAEPAAAAVQRLVLAEDPGAALAVLAAKAEGATGRAVVRGRIASIVPGHAVFTLMDTELPYCGEHSDEDDCKTPWDYCCESAETRTEHALLVEARDAAGAPLATAALPDLRLLDEVKVVGELEVDEHGNHVLVASGWFRTARPELPDDLKWPR